MKQKHKKLDVFAGQQKQSKTTAKRSILKKTNKICFIIAKKGKISQFIRLFDQINLIKASGVGQPGVPVGLITRRSEVQILSPLYLILSK